jgi:hypothetical protein
MQADIQNQGYSAGLIAATAARSNQPLRYVDLAAIQKQLVQIGIIPASALDAKDSYPLPPEQISAAVASARNGKGMAVILTHTQQALPQLKSAYANSASAEDRLNYARVLAVLGDNSGLDTLIGAVDSASWDKGWNYTGMGQFGSSLSPVDSLIVALGRPRDGRGLAPVLKKLSQLDAKSEFSHHRAVALALECIGDPGAAGPLADLLSKPGMSGHAITTVDAAARLSGANPNDTSTRAASIRELTLARALYHCGDKDGLARKILGQYTQDLRGHLARHAQALLDGK